MLARASAPSLPWRRIVSRTLGSIASAFAFWCCMALMMAACTVTVTSSGFTCTRSMAYVTAMKSDLRNMVSAQEAFRADHGRFATNGILESGAMGKYFRQSTGVRMAIGSVDGRTWRARATHARLEGASCTIDSVTGEPRCEAPTGRLSRVTAATLPNLMVDFWLFAMTLALRRRAANARASLESEPAT